MAVGLLAIALGTALIPFAASLPLLVLTIGVLGAGGAGALGPSVLMGAVARRIDPARRGMANGIVGAGGSFGQFAIIPLASAMLAGLGWTQALWGLALLTLLALPMVLPLRVPAAEAGVAAAAGGPTMGEAVRGALRDPGFLLLTSGFFVCASTSRSSRPTCRAWSSPAACRPRSAPGRSRSSACSTSPAASGSAGPWDAGG
jgi:MFS family permease